MKRAWSCILLVACASAPKPAEPLAAAVAPQELSALQALAERQRWTFSLGMSQVARLPLSRVTGLVLPPVEQRARLQHPPPLKAPLREPNPCDPGSAALDWVSLGVVTPVRKQGDCNSCWAFAALAAYEAVYAIAHNSSADTSEQELVSCSLAGNCSAGGWYGPAWDYMMPSNPGDPTESTFPYVAQDVACPAQHGGPFHVSGWAFVDPSGGMPSTAAIKSALCEHGPLAVAVCATPAFHYYKGGLFNENANCTVNHAVTLTGWDDSRQAWHLKNSWWTDWGEQGYMWIKYGSNQVGEAAAWVATQ